MANLIMRNNSGLTERLVRVLKVSEAGLLSLDDGSERLPGVMYTDQGNGILVNLSRGDVEAKTSVIGAFSMADTFTNPVEVSSGTEKFEITTPDEFVDVMSSLNFDISISRIGRYPSLVGDNLIRYVFTNNMNSDAGFLIKAEPEDLEYLGPPAAVTTLAGSDLVGLGFKPLSKATEVVEAPTVIIRGRVAVEVFGIILPYSIEPGFLDEFFDENTSYGIKVTQLRAIDADRTYEYEFRNTGIAPRDIRLILLDADGAFTDHTFTSLNNFNTVVGTVLKPVEVDTQTPLVPFAGVIEIQNDGPYYVNNGTETTEIYGEENLIEYLKANGYEVTILNEGGDENV